MRLAHPIIPYITEELWQQVAPLAGIKGDTIMQQPYPAFDESKLDEKAINDLEWVKTFVMGVRRIRSEMDIAPSKALPVLLQDYSEKDQTLFQENEAFVKTLAKIESVEWLTDQQAPESATALIGDMKILIPLAGLIDKDAEIARLEKEIGKIAANLEKSEAKMSNASFVDKAPEAVVAKERQRIEEMHTAVKQLNEQLEKIQAI